MGRTATPSRNMKIDFGIMIKDQIYSLEQRSKKRSCFVSQKTSLLFTDDFNADLEVFSQKVTIF